MSEWISIEDELPDEGDKIIAFSNGNVVFAYYSSVWNDRATFRDPFMAQSDYGPEDLEDVTHWMPRPAPPPPPKVGFFFFVGKKPPTNQKNHHKR